MNVGTRGAWIIVEVHQAVIQLAEMGIANTSLQVNGTGPGDSEPPVVTNFELSATTVDIDSSPDGFVTIDVTLATADGGGSGIAGTNVNFQNTSTGQSFGVDFGPGETQRTILLSTASDAVKRRSTTDRYGT